MEDLQSKPVQTIELTSKSLKVQIFFSVALFILGIILFFTHIPFVAILGLLIMLAGAVWFGITKIQIWWNHK